MNIIRIGLFLVFYLGICFSGIAQGPPITVETPVMLGLEGSGIRTFGRWVSTEQSKNYIHVFAFPYNISSKFQVGGVFPFGFKSLIDEETVSGFGDITVFGKYQLYKKDGKAKTFRVLAKLAQTFPTGKTSTTPSIGSDLFQTYFGLVIGRITSKIGIYGDMGYNLTNNSASDNLNYNFSVGAPILPHKYPQNQLNVFLELNGNYILDDKTNRLFLSPGLQYIPGRRMLLEASFQHPLFQKEDVENEINYQWLIGLRFLIN